VGFVAAFFLLVLAPTSSIMPIADLAVEHRMYLPLAALAVLAVLAGHQAIGWLSQRWGWSKTKQFAVGAGLLLLVALPLGWRTALRNEDYHDHDLLWTRVIELQPKNSRAHHNLALSLEMQGRREEAEQHYRRALEIHPYLAVVHNKLAACLGTQGKFKEAEYNLAAALNKQGKHSEAAEHCRAVLKRRPDFAQAHNLLAACLAREGNLDEAVKHCLAAIRIRPDFAAAHHNLATWYLRQGKKALAVQHFQIASRLNPSLQFPQP
jgi:Flp pilus assembly protein TadD